MSERDVIDEALGVAPGDWLDGLRRAREEARLRAQTSYLALFERGDFSALSAHARFAAAARVAEVSGARSLAEYYARRRDEADADTHIEELLVYAGTAARAPAEVSRDDLERLALAGLSPAAIVTLSQIVGLVAYQARVVAALSALRAQA